MLKFTLKRLASLVVVLIGVSFLVFMLLSLTPGDPVRMMLGESATPEAQEALREEMGLNDPLLVQYGRYMKNIIVHQDLGTSYTTQKTSTRRNFKCFSQYSYVGRGSGYHCYRCWDLFRDYLGG